MAQAGLLDRFRLMAEFGKLLIGQPILQPHEQFTLLPADVPVERLADPANHLRIRIALAAQTPGLLGQVGQPLMLVEKPLSICVARQFREQPLFIREVRGDLRVPRIDKLGDGLAPGHRV